MAKNENKEKLKWVSTLGKSVRSLIPGSDAIERAIKKRKANSQLEPHQKAARNKAADYKKMRDGKMSKEKFIKKYPNSATARASRSKGQGATGKKGMYKNRTVFTEKDLKATQTRSEAFKKARKEGKLEQWERKYYPERYKRYDQGKKAFKGQGPQYAKSSPQKAYNKKKKEQEQQRIIPGSKGMGSK